MPNFNNNQNHNNKNDQKTYSSGNQIQILYKRELTIGGVVVDAFGVMYLFQLFQLLFYFSRIKKESHLF